jgi:hypothetical protein
MLYIERDQNGEVIAVHHTPCENATEKKSTLDAELIEFLNNSIGDDPWLRMLSMSDMSTIRILEDLIDILIKKNIILLTELPEGAQAKISERKMARQKMNSQEFMVNDII